MAKVLVFSKDAWLESANEQKARGLLSDREIDDACEIWVDALDGKPKSEFETKNGAPVRDEWFIEVEV